MIYTPFREKGAAYYDRIYEAGDSRQAYLPVREAVLDFLTRMPAARVLEVGCGAGELGHLVTRQGIPYRGFDISAVAVRRCRERGVRGARVASAYDTASYRPVDYNVLVALGVFERIDDRGAIRLFPPGIQVLFSVPDFVETAHLRAYQDPEEDIRAYFGDLLTIGEILPFEFVGPDGGMLTVYLVRATVGAPVCDPA